MKNKKTNPYLIFLMIELARVNDVIAKDLEYDMTWEKGEDLFAEFKDSKFNDPNEGVYELIEQFLIDKVENATSIKGVLNKASITQIPQSALLDEVAEALEGREMFKDADHLLGERIFCGSVFEAILQEGDGFGTKLSKKGIKQLDELSTLIDSEYVQITMI